jgi:hypothetical protein
MSFLPSHVNRIQQHDISAALKLGRVALGAFALGALAAGTLAVGYLAIGGLMVHRARIRRLEIDDLVVRHVRRAIPDGANENEFG